MLLLCLGGTWELIRSSFLAPRTEFLRGQAFHVDHLSVFLGKLSKVRVTSLIYRLENGAREQASPLM